VQQELLTSSPTGSHGSIADYGLNDESPVDNGDMSGHDVGEHLDFLDEDQEAVHVQDERQTSSPPNSSKVSLPQPLQPLGISIYDFVKLTVRPYSE
jgi:hypothetical protein